jgi:GNAT superfamily N-acetyltransferase
MLACEIDRRFLRRWIVLKSRVAARGGDPAALDWDYLQEYLLPDLFEDRGLRLEPPSKQSSFGYFVFFAQPGGGSIYGKRKITVSLDDALAYHDLLIADPQPSGIRIADRLMKSAVELYMDLRLKRIELRAGLSGGGRLWPKYGFRPKTEADWHSCKEQIRSNLRGLDDSVQQRWGTTVERLLHSNSPRTIWSVSEIPYRFQGYKLGDILLTGTKWHGILDLEDPETIRRLAARLNTV